MIVNVSIENIANSGRMTIHDKNPANFAFSECTSLPNIGTKMIATSYDGYDHKNIELLVIDIKIIKGVILFVTEIL